MLNARESKRHKRAHTTALLATAGLVAGGLSLFGMTADAATAAAPVSARTATGTGTTSMTVTWPSVKGASNYRVKWSLTKDMANLSRFDAGTKTSTVLTGLKTNTTYYVTVNVN